MLLAGVGRGSNRAVGARVRFGLRVGTALQDAAGNLGAGALLLLRYEFILKIGMRMCTV